jgi:hypothetical protein
MDTNRDPSSAILEDLARKNKHVLAKQHQAYRQEDANMWIPGSHNLTIPLGQDMQHHAN